jgi:hypothetical protein
MGFAYVDNMSYGFGGNFGSFEEAFDFGFLKDKTLDVKSFLEQSHNKVYCTISCRATT